MRVESACHIFNGVLVNTCPWLHLQTQCANAVPSDVPSNTQLILLGFGKILDSAVSYKNEKNSSLSANWNILGHLKQHSSWIVWQYKAFQLFFLEVSVGKSLFEMFCLWICEAKYFYLLKKKIFPSLSCLLNPQISLTHQKCTLQQTPSELSFNFV